MNDSDVNKGNLMRGIIVFLCAAIITTFLGYSCSSSLGGLEPSTKIEVKDKTDNIAVSLPNEDPSIGELDDNRIPEEEDEKEEEDTDQEDVEVSTVTNDTLAYYIINGLDKKILDLRSESDYTAGYIRTSKSYDADNFSFSDFTSYGSYVLVCSKDTCKDAQNIISKVSTIVSDIEVLENGFEGWDEEGYRVCTAATC